MQVLTMKVNAKLALFLGLMAAQTVQANTTKTLAYTINYTQLAGYTATPPAGYQAASVGVTALPNYGTAALVIYYENNQGAAQPTTVPPALWLTTFNGVGAKISQDALPVQVVAADCKFTRPYNRCPSLFANVQATQGSPTHYFVQITKADFDPVTFLNKVSGYLYTLDVQKAAPNRWTLISSYLNQPFQQYFGLRENPGPTVAPTLLIDNATAKTTQVYTFTFQ
jgi:hypothetical protein